MTDAYWCVRDCKGFVTGAMHRTDADDLAEHYDTKFPEDAPHTVVPVTGADDD